MSIRTFILWIDVHYQEHIPADALPSPWCQTHRARRAALLIAAPSWRQPLLLAENGPGLPCKPLSSDR